MRESDLSKVTHPVICMVKTQRQLSVIRLLVRFSGLVGAGGILRWKDFEVEK